jgi:hypothetical protein
MDYPGRRRTARRGGEMIASKYIDLRLNAAGRWVSLVQCCMVLPEYIEHATAAEAMEHVTDFAEKYQRYMY